MLKTLFFIPIFLSMASAAQLKLPVTMEWSKAAELRDENGKPLPGYAGPVVGFSHDIFITAGGANFPDGLPWEGGKKVYHNSIHAFKVLGEKWEPLHISETLPQAVAYAGTASTPYGIVYAGGENESGILKEAWLFIYDTIASRIQISSLPHLPLALTNIAMAVCGNLVYAAGGDMKSATSAAFFVLDLAASTGEMKWKKLPDIPMPLANAALISLKNKLYLIGGRTKTATGISDLHGTVFSFDPQTEEWQKHGPIRDGERITNWSAAAVAAIDDKNILVIGGDDGRAFHEIETLISKIKNTDNEAQKAALIAKKTALQAYHPGFNRSLLLYNTVTNRWTKIGEYPYPAQVMTAAIAHNGKIIISNGEIKPGIRTPDIIAGTIKESGK